MKKSLFIALLFAASSFPLVVQHASAFSVLANYTLNGTLADAEAPSNPARNMTVIGSSTYTLGGIQLTGTSYLESPSIASFTTGNFTITANFRITSYPADYMPVFTAFDSQIAALITNTGAIQLRVGTSTTTGSLIVPLSQFNNVTITRDGTTTRLYLNGVIAVTSTASVTSATNTVLTRSNISSVLRYFNGVMKNLQVYSSATVVTGLTDSSTPAVGELRWAFQNIPSGGSIVFSPTLSGTIDLTTNGTIFLGSTGSFGAMTVCEPPSGSITLRMNRNVPTVSVIEFEIIAAPFPDDKQSSAKKPPLPLEDKGENKLAAVGSSSNIFNIAGITIDGNSAGGGGIRFSNPGGFVVPFAGTFRATDCAFNNCQTSGNGGAIDIQTNGSAGFNFTNCTFNNNRTSGFGGAISNAATNTVDITNCTFTNNQASFSGGAIGHGNGGTTNITNSIFSNNASTRDGGAITLQTVASAGALTMNGCTINNNSASSGLPSGGLLVVTNGAGNATVNLTNCTFTGNTSSSSAAGIVLTKQSTGNISAALRNCTISGNNPGGLGIFGGASATLLNTIVAGNVSSDVSGAIVTAGSTNNLIGNGTGMTGISNSVNGNQVGTSPAPINARLAALGSYGGATQTVALLPGSPAINAGTASGAPATDQRGISRVGTTDIGAFESRGFTITATGGSPQTTLVSTAFPVALQASVTSSFSEPVNGGVITFTPPGSGASCTFGTNPVTIARGNVSTTATANSTFGSYVVTASASGITTPASYSLVNLAAQPTGSSGIPNLSTLPTHPPNITVNFTPASPTPTGYLVVRRPSITPRTDPADGTAYTVGNVFSGQTVVSVGTATSFTDNTVTFGESYFYDVYPFNGSGAAINYFQSGVQTNATALTALPVELSDFKAQQHERGVELVWTTASEKNNAGFEVQRRTENSAGASWSVLGFVKGNGTTSEAKSYSFVDRTASGKAQYRLKQVDFDGAFEILPTVEVDAGLPRSFELAQNYPNPFNPSTAISYQLPISSEVRLKVYDMLGREVATLVNGRQEAGRYSVSWNAAGFASGVYFYRLQASNFVETRKMMLVK